MDLIQGHLYYNTKPIADQIVYSRYKDSLYCSVSLLGYLCVYFAWQIRGRIISNQAIVMTFLVVVQASDGVLYMQTTLPIGLSWEQVTGSNPTGYLASSGPIVILANGHPFQTTYIWADFVKNTTVFYHKELINNERV